MSWFAQSSLRNGQFSSPELYTWGCGHVEPCVFIQNHSLTLTPFFKVRACSWVEWTSWRRRLAEDVTGLKDALGSPTWRSYSNRSRQSPRASSHRSEAVVTMSFHGESPLLGPLAWQTLFQKNASSPAGPETGRVTWWPGRTDNVRPLVHHRRGIQKPRNCRRCQLRGGGLKWPFYRHLSRSLSPSPTLPPKKERRNRGKTNNWKM